MTRLMRGVLLLGTLMAGIACQSPTDPDDVVDYDEIVDVSVSPDPAIASVSSGRTYRIVRGNNQPDEIAMYDWETIFTVTVNLNSNATDDDVDVDFPVRISSATLAVKQAAGGIVTPPTGGEVEHYEFVPLNATGNQIGAVNNPISMTFHVWYDLPSLRREALIPVTFTFIADDGVSFSKLVDVRVAP